MKRIYFLSIVMFLGIIVLSIVTSAARLELYLCLPCLFMVTITPFVVLLATFTPREMGRSFHAAFQGVSADPATLRTAGAFFKAAQSYVVLSGVAGAFVGLVAMLAEISDNTDVGFGMALVLMTLLYSVCLLIIVVIPFRTAIARKDRELRSA